MTDGEHRRRSLRCDVTADHDHDLDTLVYTVTVTETSAGLSTEQPQPPGSPRQNAAAAVPKAHVANDEDTTAPRASAQAVSLLHAHRTNAIPTRRNDTYVGTSPPAHERPCLWHQKPRRHNAPELNLKGATHARADDDVQPMPRLRSAPPRQAT